MGRSLRELYVHLVWTTKNRKPILRGQLELFVHQRIREIAEDYDLSVLAGNSAWNHVHVLCRWDTKTRLADVVREWKSRTYHEWNRADHEVQLAWQDGYGAFSVSPHEVRQLIQYISDQKQHHRDKTTIDRYERRYG